jgi:DNA-binding LytR/AlgR family response regulator
VLIVEDQVLVAEGIATVLRKNSLEVAGIFSSGEDALDFVRGDSPDLVLMDIKLAGKIDGIKTASAIQQLIPIPIIYLTDLTDKKIFERAKQTNPTNYLSKPFNDNDLVKAIDLAIHNRSKPLSGKSDPLADTIFLRVGLKHVKFLLDDIDYLQADRSYCDVVSGKATHKVSISMNHVLEQLDSTQFCRVHRSFAVNVKKIKEVDGNMILVGPAKIQMAGEYRDNLMRQLNFLK